MPLISKLVEPLIARQRKMRTSQFEVLPEPDVDILFLGDSITEGGLWGEWFPAARTANRGVAGERTEGILARLDGIGKAAQVFLLIGTNDLGVGVKHEEIVANVALIVDRLKALLPDADIVLQSVMPRKRKFVPSIERLNGAYRDLARDRHIRYLDLWPALSTEAGSLRAEFTLDGLHLNGEGYRAWVKLLAPYVRSGI